MVVLATLGASVVILLIFTGIKTLLAKAGDKTETNKGDKQ